MPRRRLPRDLTVSSGQELAEPGYQATAEARAQHQASAEEQALELIQQYVRATERGGAPPLDIVSPVYTRYDWTEGSGDDETARHRWEVTGLDLVGQAWVVMPGDWTTVALGPNSVTRAPTALLYNPETPETLLAGALIDAAVRSHPSLPEADLPLDHIDDVRTVASTPRVIGPECDCDGSCGLPLWAKDSGWDLFRDAANPFASYATNRPQPSDDYDLVRAVFNVLSEQLERQGLTWPTQVIVKAAPLRAGACRSIDDTVLDEPASV
jgi:hypothetical protein